MYRMLYAPDLKATPSPAEKGMMKRARNARFSRTSCSSGLCGSLSSGCSAMRAGTPKSSPPSTNVHQGDESRTPADLPLLNVFKALKTPHQGRLFRVGAWARLLEL